MPGDNLILSQPGMRGQARLVGEARDAADHPAAHRTAPEWPQAQAESPGFGRPAVFPDGQHVDF